MLQFEQKTYLKSLRNRLDKMSMAHSIKSRVPFLDNSLVDFLQTKSDTVKIFMGKSKWIVHQSAEMELPKMIARRKKMVFSNSC